MECIKNDDMDGLPILETKRLGKNDPNKQTNEFFIPVIDNYKDIPTMINSLNVSRAESDWFYHVEVNSPSWSQTYFIACASGWTRSTVWLKGLNDFDGAIQRGRG